MSIHQINLGDIAEEDLLHTKNANEIPCTPQLNMDNYYDTHTYVLLRNNQ